MAQWGKVLAAKFDLSSILECGRRDLALIELFLGLQGTLTWKYTEINVNKVKGKPPLKLPCS